MAADRLLPVASACLALGLIVAMLLLVQRRRLRLDLAGRVKADAYLAMIRAMLVLLAGLALALIAIAGGRLPFDALGRGIAAALVAIGGIGFLARAALYLLRIKPQLDRLSVPVAPASPAAGSREIRPGDE